MILRACTTPIAHGVGSYKRAIIWGSAGLGLKETKWRCPAEHGQHGKATGQAIEAVNDVERIGHAADGKCREKHAEKGDLEQAVDPWDADVCQGDADQEPGNQPRGHGCHRVAVVGS